MASLAQLTPFLALLRAIFVGEVNCFIACDSSARPDKVLVSMAGSNLSKSSCGTLRAT